MRQASVSFDPIGTITTPYRQKFAIPRQPNLVDARGQITLREDIHAPAVFKGLDNFSHLWLLFVFHQTQARGWKPAVKMPRLGGNATLGVFASRSTHRPNPVGMSVVRNLGWKQSGGTLTLNVGGVDLLCDTPILDIKPYIPYADAQSEATDTLTPAHPSHQRDVSFCDAVWLQLKDVQARYPDFIALLTGVLAQDPRPAYRQKLDDDERLYHVALYDIDVHWQVSSKKVCVQSISPFKE
ncbi:tRNA (N6-threonylcarbamoyladenosine(37)-N6)-methyltransferase TrmO [Alteromonas halophila]|uniref:tRNA (N6-threonylcarbamoyladenosine(37)-N6)-methyltransferase TrmO n=1 Tax=Alteromonas halophila TaxID=516698 RepID=A0A918JM33_9ALTE|nr:tRNA (N6-threonylcarbamoyladenosine(37)-N6)-methyltransferase TrmO [Alteromonas halophila]GGW86350.1 tRNA (N6-threonylcarbamoyladenosine(37)-N6)-methyltransferase TrmO [Alteromonas halophila]